MTSPPFFFECKHCNQDKICGDYPEWWICQRCFFKNTYNRFLCFKWVSCRPTTDKELEGLGRPKIDDDLSKKYKTYEERLKKLAGEKLTKEAEQ